MSTPDPVSPTFRPGRRRSVARPATEWVRSRPLREDQTLPWLLEPAVDGLDPVAWGGDHRDQVEELVNRHGAVLFRGFEVADAERFESFVSALSGEPLAYLERSSPRHAVHRNVYTSTDHPADQSIFPHNEHSYRWTFPLRIFFYCHQPAEEGGETPLADCRRVLARVPPEARERLLAEGYIYARNYGDEIGLSWQNAFQTSERAEVEEYCRRMHIEFEWLSGGRLRTRQRRPVVARHPGSGDAAWFNHLTFFHVTTLAPDLRHALRSQLADHELPNNTYYGDGGDLEPEVVEALRSAYLEEKVSFPWQRGDVLMVDNLLTSHAREPFRGERRVLTAMTQPVSWDQVSTEVPT